MTPTTATIHVICVGDELLRGDTTNTNLADLGQLLARHGLAVAAAQWTTASGRDPATARSKAASSVTSASGRSVGTISNAPPSTRQIVRPSMPLPPVSSTFFGASPARSDSFVSICVQYSTPRAFTARRGSR